MNGYVEVGLDEGYFAEDFDQVHCKHGAYIGYPGGPDYICPYCEDGADTLVKFGIIWIFLLSGGVRHELGKLYSIYQIRDWSKFLSIPTGPDFEIEIEFDFEYGWVRKEDES